MLHATGTLCAKIIGIRNGSKRVSGTGIDIPVYLTTFDLSIVPLVGIMLLFTVIMPS